jgi:hypothetical protein
LKPDSFMAFFLDLERVRFSRHDPEVTPATRAEVSTTSLH